MTQKYIGVKLINAHPMTRTAYNEFRGWKLPADENGEDEGYLVEYLDGGKPNTDRFDGYVSWSPKDVFDNAYRPVSGLSFGLAIEALKLGKRVARAGWNGKGMSLILVPGTKALYPREGTPYADIKVSPSGVVDINPHIDMKTATGEMQPGWLASQTDMLANDWSIIE